VANTAVSAQRYIIGSDMSSSSVDSSKPEFEGSVSGLSGRYASALFELMQEAPDTDQKDISNSMDVLSGLFGVDQSFGDMLVSPVISVEDKENALVKIFSKASIGQTTDMTNNILAGSKSGMGKSRRDPRASYRRY